MKDLKFWVAAVIFVVTIVFAAGKIDSDVGNNTADISELRGYYTVVKNDIGEIRESLARMEGTLIEALKRR